VTEYLQERIPTQQALHFSISHSSEAILSSSLHSRHGIMKHFVSNSEGLPSWSSILKL